MVFVFDLDDTICDSNGYSAKYISNFFISHNLPYKKVCNITRFAEKKFDWDDETALSWYLKYGDQMMLEFPPRGNTIEVINKLHDDGHKIVICTARANDWHSDPVGITYKWLENSGLKYDKIYIGRLDKEQVCLDENADVFVDDDIKITKRVAETFVNKNHGHVFLMNTDYNLTQNAAPNVSRINNMEELIKNLENNGQISQL